MGTLSPYFEPHEFACPCGCGLTAVDPKLIQEVLHPTRVHFGGALIITSGCRCDEYNRRLRFCPTCESSVKSAPGDKQYLCPSCGHHTRQRSSVTSWHKPRNGVVHAADFKVIDKTGKMKYVLQYKVQNFVEALPIIRERGGLGRYRSFTHADTRGWKARWYG